MIRLQTGEAREQRVFLTDDDGAALTGLVPVATARRADTGAVLPAPAVREVGGGFYAVPPASVTVDHVVVVDRGTPGPGRLVALEVLVGGYVDQVDAAVSSRAAGSAVVALGVPAQAADLTRVEGRVVDLGQPAQTSALTLVSGLVAQTRADVAALTGLVAALGDPAQDATVADALADLDTILVRLAVPTADVLALVQTRSSQASVAALGAPLQTDDARLGSLEGQVYGGSVQ